MGHGIEVCECALNVALYSKQIKQAKWPAHVLFSEDLW